MGTILPLRPCTCAPPFACVYLLVARWHARVSAQARALANACSKSGHRISFFMRKGADCLSKWVGEAERQLRLLFEQARRHQVTLNPGDWFAVKHQHSFGSFPHRFFLRRTPLPSGRVLFSAHSTKFIASAWLVRGPPDFPGRASRGQQDSSVCFRSLCASTLTPFLCHVVSSRLVSEASKPGTAIH